MNSDEIVYKEDLEIAATYFGPWVRQERRQGRGNGQTIATLIKNQVKLLARKEFGLC